MEHHFALQWLIYIIDMYIWGRKVIKIDNFSKKNSQKYVHFAEKLFKKKLYWVFLDNTGDWFGESIISLNKEFVDLFCEYREINDIKNMWIFLWYPACCIDEYIKISQCICDTPKIDLLYANRTYYDKFTKPFLKWGYVIHFPCSYRCEITEEKYKKIIKLISKLFPEYGKYLIHSGKQAL